ncbi:hypothetical protein LJC06_04260 [Bacteroidales bacterium OttesenSCG-928-I14]|nr:hypothetical protein [Bacteroidales bacterium OttesenSCG-928-I14]
MGKQMDPIKARAQIIRLFNQPNLYDRRVEILTDLAQSLTNPPEELERENARLKRELELYKRNAGAVLRKFIIQEMKAGVVM